MSYFTAERREDIVFTARQHAREGSDLWSFCHSVLMNIAESQGGQLLSGKEAQGSDGFYRMRNGEFDVNSAAEHLQIALETRAEFLRDKSENDKSG